METEKTEADSLPTSPGTPLTDATVEGATVDLDRQRRCGFGEVIFGQGKSTELMCEIVKAQLTAGQNSLITRIENTAAVQMRRLFPHAYHNSLASTLRISDRPITRRLDEAISSDEVHVAVVTAGSTDAAIAEEAAETLDWMGVAVRRFFDVGVAGPQRLLAVVPELRKASAVVVMAGMEGALPPTLAGHVAVPVIAVPTSVGYGVNFGGLTPLMGMLTSCAANVAVVNIDAGFKGGYIAGMIASGISAAKQSSSASP
ncbi:MAG: nickel pincer cofactor biosynthesis protein LarB [Planctomycetota bacterium]